MSSDNIHLEESTSSITIVGLATTIMRGPFMSEELLRAIEECIKNKKKVVCIYNRRGSAKSYVCGDCGYQKVCPYCNISLSYHTTPTKRLICHQCNYIDEVFIVCPQCHGSHITPIGIGIEKIELAMRSYFPQSRTIRIDSDAKKQEKNLLLQDLDTADIIVGTQMALTTYHEDIGLIAFLLIDSDMAIPEFDREEKIYSQIVYAKRMGIPVIVQTYAPESSFIDMILHGNFRSFLTSTLEERKKFSYPPYSDFVTLWVHSPSQDMVRDIIHKLVNKIEIIALEDIFVAYDRDIWEKLKGEWRQKIILKGKGVNTIISELHTELLKNRQVYIDRH